MYGFRSPREVLALAFLALGVGPANAWVNDRNANRIDDRIERVHAKGYRAAFVAEDPSKRMMFGVTQGPALVYAVRVRYGDVPTAAEIAALQATGVPWVHPYAFIPYARTEATYAQIEVIAALPGVSRVEVVPVLYLLNHVGSRVVRARDSRGYMKMQDDVLFPSAREQLGLDGYGITVAIFDTGVNDAADVATSYPGHESLAGKFLGGGEFFYGNPALNTPNNGSMNPQDHGAAASEYHATHVAGIVMGSGGPSGTFAGVAPAAKLVDCKVLSDAGASLSGVPEALEWCLFHKDRAWPGEDIAYRGIDVVNMSLGDVLSSDGTEADAVAVNDAVSRGLIVVAASGNLGLTEWIASPGSADLSICVGASTHNKTLDRSDDQVTSFSQEGPRADDGDADHLDEMKPNLVAPGSGIVSADGDPTTEGREYKSLSGTSMASPHVAGCVALLLQANPSLTPMQVRTILQNTADHNPGNEKGDRPNDPFGIDPNYDPGSGWGLVDVYAAALEAMNSASGVQLAQMKKPRSRVADGAIDLGWITQREYPFQGFEVHRAVDAGGSPGTFARINPTLVPPSPAGDPNIQGDDNRTSYAYVDSDPALQVGGTYWYRVAWVDQAGVPHPEPALRVEYGEAPRVATAYYAITHDSPDSDLNIRVGTSSSYDAGSPQYVTLGPGAVAQDSFQIATIDFVYVPPGHIRHFWSIPFTTNDGIGSFLPPGPLHPWFLDVEEGGFVDQNGRVESFSMFVNDAPGSSSGTTYVTSSTTPQQTVEGLHTTLWIPQSQSVDVAVARFAAEAEAGGVRVVLALSASVSGRAVVYRSTSQDFATAAAISEPLVVSGDHFEYLDVWAEPETRYYYWVSLGAEGRTTISGPVQAMVRSLTFLASPAPNPIRGRALFRYFLGPDLAASGQAKVTLDLIDTQGRKVRRLDQGSRAGGEHQVPWDGLDAGGAPARAGIYFLRLQAAERSFTTRISVAR